MKRRILILFAMIIGAMSASAAVAEDSYIYEIGQSTGAWTASNAAGTWASNWASTQTDPCTVNFNSGANNMTYTSGNITGYGGTAKTATYTLSTSDAQYYISDVTFDLAFVDGASSAMTLTLADGTAYTGSASDQAVAISGLNAQNYSMTLSGANAGVTYKNLKVTVKYNASYKPVTTFKVFDNSGSIPYRIPAICTTATGTLVATADYRTSKSDIGNGRIDLHVRTSNDNGTSWNDILMPSNMQGDGNMSSGNQAAGYGDPCIVADRESGKILLTSCSGYPGFFNGTRTQHLGWARWYSTDEGQTWTGPEYIDEANVYSKFDGSAYGAIRGWFVGSGKIHQSRYTKVKDYYRLYCAGSSYNGSTTANWVLYSDDFGQTWEFLGGCDQSPVDGGDEPKIEELPNGNVVISSRNASGRYYNIFSFSNMEKAEGAWGTKALSSSAVSGLTANNGCNGEIQVLPVIRKADGVHTWLVFQSLPTSGRTNVSIFYKDLEEASTYANPTNLAKDWTGHYQVSSTTSAYSTWSMCSDHTFGFLYEENSSNSGYDIIYKNISIENITNDAYEYDTTADPYTLPESIILQQSLNGLLQEAQKAYDANEGTVSGDGLVESASQLSCDFGQNDHGSTDGGGLDALIDGSASTYYHTYWGGGSVADGTHYFDVTAPESGNFEGKIDIKVVRRAAADDHVKTFTITGSNDGTTFESVAVVDMPNATSGASSEAQFAIADGKSYKYLRFTVSATSTGRGYWHMAEFQLYKITDGFNDENPEVAAALETAISKAQALTAVTQDDIDELQNALDTYTAAAEAAKTFNPDPSKLYRIEYIAQGNYLDMATLKGQSDCGSTNEIAVTFTDEGTPVKIVNTDDGWTIVYNDDTYLAHYVKSTGGGWTCVASSTADYWTIEGIASEFTMQSTSQSSKYCDVEKSSTYSAWQMFYDKATAGKFRIVEYVAPPLATAEDIEAAKANIVLGVGYPLETSAGYIALNEATEGTLTKAELATLLTNYKSETDVLFPEDGKAYTISVIAMDGTRCYMKYAATGYTLVGTTATDNSAYPEEAIVVCRKVDDKFAFVNHDGKYFLWKGAKEGQNSNLGYADTYTADWNLTIEKMVSGSKASLSNDNYFGYLVAKGSRNNTSLTSAYFVVDKSANYNQASDVFFNETYSSALKFEEVAGYKVNTPTLAASIEIEDADQSIATYCAQYPTVAPEGVQPWKVTIVEGGNATIEKVSGKIPAGTGVLLTGAAGKTLLLPATDEEAGDFSGNKLVGVTKATDLPADAGIFILANKNNVVAFYPATAGTLAANKAYLQHTSSSVDSNAIINIEYGSQTGISGVTVVEQSCDIFDLQGRRINAPVRGQLYIANGQKFIQK